MVKEIKSQKQFDRIMGSEKADDVSWCSLCGRVYLIDWKKKEIDAMMKWSNREILIQDALPNRTIYERELMGDAWNGRPSTGCCKECHEKHFGSME